jgi:alpha-tubulin suppressor-like RCC1 family protein
MSSSAKFKLEVKATEASVAKFSSGTTDTNIIITPDYYSNIHYAVIGTKSSQNTVPSQVYISAGSNGYDTSVASFTECNINFYKDTIVRGNLVVDGLITALELDVVLSSQDVFAGTNHSGFIDASSNVLSFKYAELTDTSILRTSNTILHMIQSSFSNLYTAGRSVLQGSSDFLDNFASENIYNPDKFDERLGTKTADDIANGTNNRYIFNDRFNNNLIVKGDFTADDITTKSVFVENEVSATTFYADGSHLTNIIAGDGTMNSLIEGSNLFYKPAFVGAIAASSNIHTSNYADALYSTDLQTSISGKVQDTSNFVTETSNIITEILYNEIANLSNYVISGYANIEQALAQTSMDNYTYIDENIQSSSNYMVEFDRIYVASDALSNLLIFTINPAIADASNYIHRTSNTSYTSLAATDANILSDIQRQSSDIIHLQAGKWANISNSILGKEGYSNLLDTIMKADFGVHLDTYIVSHSNQAVLDIDAGKSSLISHIDDIRDARMDAKTEYYTQQMADISDILSDLHLHIDTNSITGSNAVDTVRENIVNYLNAMIQRHVEHLQDTSNLFHTTSNVTNVGILEALKNTLDYERHSSNELMHTLDANIARLLGNANFVLNKTNADIGAKLSALDADSIPEGTSNIYYTEAEFDRLFAKLSFDNFAQGANNKFIVNNAYNGNLRVLGTIFASNMTIDGELSTILTNVYQSGTGRISSSNDIPLSVTQLSQDSTAYIFGLSNVLNHPLFTVDTSGAVAINKTGLPSYDIDASAILKASMLKGSASSITDVNIDSKSTDFLRQGVNLYFDSSRVSYLIDTSNLNVSNYVIDTSNNLLAAFPLIDIQSNYIDQQSNIVFSYSSNMNVNTFNYLLRIADNISNLVGVSSNNHSNYVLLTSNALTIHTSNSLVNISNYVTTSCNALLQTLKFNEFLQSNYMSIVNSSVSFSRAETDGSNYILRTSNMLSATMDNARIEINQSNYLDRSCNMLFNSIRSSNFHMSNYLLITSNNLMRSLGTSNVNISNYIWRTSNELMRYVFNNLGTISATTNSYTITDVFSSDKIMHFNFNNVKIINNADDANFQLLNRTTITPVYPAINSVTAVNNVFTQYETANRHALASSNNIYVFNNDDTDAKTVLNMMNTSGFVIHFVFRAQFVQNTPIYFIGNNSTSFVNIKLLYGNLQMTLGNGADAITLICLTPIVPFTWYVVDIAGVISGGNIMFKVWLNRILQNIIVRRNTSVSTAGLLLYTSYNNVLDNSTANNLQMLLGCSNLIDTYEENFPYTLGAIYTNTYYSSNPWTIPYIPPILRSVASDYWSFSNLIFSSYYASNFDYQYSSNISSGNSAIIANATTYANFYDYADARLVIGDRSITNINYVLTEVETNVRLRTGYYFFMLDLQKEITADLLLGEQGDSKIDDYFNVAYYYNQNGNVLSTTPSATIGDANNRVLANPLYIPEGYYRFYLRMFRTAANRNNKYFISQYYYTNTWSGSSFSLNNSNAVSYIPYSSLDSLYRGNKTNFNNLFMVNNNATGATSNLYVYRYSMNNSPYSCGRNANGQLGIGTAPPYNTIIPTYVKDSTSTNIITNIENIAAGSETSFFIEKNTGKVYACGINDYRQLGIASTSPNIFKPTLVKDSLGTNEITNISNIVCGKSYTLFLEKNTGKVYACGDNGEGQLGINSTTTLFTLPTLVKDTGGTNAITNIVNIAAGADHSLFLERNDGITYTGRVYACGNNSYAQLGINLPSKTKSIMLLPVLDTGGTNTITNIVNIAAGNYHSLFLEKNDGITFIGRVYACGDNGQGQLGINSSSITTSHKLIPVLNTNGVDPITNIVNIAAGGTNSLFLEKNDGITFTGKVYSCGTNQYGGLGINSTTSRSRILVSVLDTTGVNAITNIANIAIGYNNNSFFIENITGKVYACGYNYEGVLGINSSVVTNPKLAHVVLNATGDVITNVIKISTYGAHSLFLNNFTVITNISNYNYNISHSNIITPNTFFAGNRLSSSNLLNIQDFKILNNPTVMATDFSINNILFNGKDSSNLVSLNKIRFNKWQETSDYASLTNKYIYYTEGNVGIGPVVPTASLDINTNPLTTFDNSIIYSMKTNRPIWTNLGLITSSDERIKKNIQDIDDNIALNQILKVEPKSYNYIDKNRNSSNSLNIYGFIAQQIREVIPQAVSLHTEAVPNIYAIGMLQSNIITVHLNNIIQPSSKVLLIDILGNRYVETVLQASQTFIEIENKNNLPSGSIFVYGTIVDDFHALDKSYIYTLNVCALQDIYRNYTSIKDKLSRYVNTYSNIPAFTSTLTECDDSYFSMLTTDDNLKNQIDFLKHASDTLMQNINTIQQYQTSNFTEIEQLKADNELLTSTNSQITKEHENLIKQISEQSQEIFTIKSILQLNNIV